MGEDSYLDSYWEDLNELRYEQDDFDAYNQNEADDYRHEGDEYGASDDAGYDDYSEGE